MELIDFWLWSCKSYFEFITRQGCAGSLSWTAPYCRWESSHLGFLVPPAAKPLCVLCSGAAHPDALRGLRTNPDPFFPPCSPVHGCARHLGVPAPAVPCRAALRARGGPGAVHSRRQAVAWWPQLGRWQAPSPSPPRVMVPVLSTATERLQTWTRCKVSPEFTDSLEAITLGCINCSFHRNKMLTGGKPRCSRQVSINAAAAAGKGGSAGSVSAMLTPMHPPMSMAHGLQFAHPPPPPRCGPPPGGRGCPAGPPAQLRVPGVLRSSVSAVGSGAPCFSETLGCH